ncbi:hypothetical protein ACFOKF_25360 [Sphingobium rhizovicinum]|uniref:Integrase n=1 Tax=Sphingobium rhizovicinum TaxID=432308 RepID=A0ABV7NIC6_9SPHN
MTGLILPLRAGMTLPILQNHLYAGSDRAASKMYELVHAMKDKIQGSARTAMRSA